MDILRDPIWQFIGVLLALIALIVSIYLYLLQRNKKSLAYEVVSDTALLTEADRYKGKLQILFDGNSVKNPHLLILQILNNGNLPITSSDFENKLIIVFSEGIQILSADTIETTPKTLKPIYTNESNKLILDPTLLNNGDTITFKLLLTKFDNKIDFETRIVGVGEIKEAKVNYMKFIIGFLISFFSLFGSFVGFILIETFRVYELKLKPEPGIEAPGLYIFFGMLLLLGCTIWAYMYSSIRKLQMRLRNYLKK